MTAHAQATIEQNVEAPLYIDLSKAWGFLMGQSLSLHRIRTRYPDLVLQVRKVELEFKASFGKAEENITKALQESLKEKYAAYTKSTQKQLETTLSSQGLNREMATTFLTEVESRARGKLPSPIIETLLTYQFRERPPEEFARGYTRVFGTKDHLKAKGVDIRIRYPASWQSREGERPNIIQKFMSENGRGSEMFLLMVKEIPLPSGYTLTEQELAEFFVERELRNTVPQGSKFISAKSIVLDNHKGGMVIFDQAMQRLDMTVTMRNIQFITIDRNKMIFVQCMVSILSGNEDDLTERFNRFEPLFKMIANSFIILDQYK
ncbi:MAG: hypothetical protein ACRERE_38570 [Candidatus Entotheonellia bacterium]